MSNKVKVNLELQTGVGRRYKITKLNGAVTVSVKDESDSNKPTTQTLRVGESMDEDQAEQLVNDFRRFDVTVVPGN